jgi:hypothetical protein
MSQQNLDIPGRTTIRDPVTMNAALFWRRKNHEFRVDVHGLTDEETFCGLFRNGFFGADLVLPEPPRTVVASVRVKF